MIWKLIFAAAIGYAIWRFVTRAMQPPPVSMQREDAARLLGIATSSGTDAVLDAHRRLIAKVHPDAGGSAELAAQINRARDVMLES